MYKKLIGIGLVTLLTGCAAQKVYPTYPTAEYSSEAMMIISKSGGQNYMQDMLVKDATNSLDQITAGDYILGMAAGYYFDTIATGGLYVLLMDSLGAKGWDRNNIIVFLNADKYQSNSNVEIAQSAYDIAKIPLFEAVKTALEPTNIYTELKQNIDIDKMYPNEKNTTWYFGHKIKKFGKNKFRYIIKPEGSVSENILGVGFQLQDISTPFSVDRLPTSISDKISYKKAIAVRFNYFSSIRTEYLLTKGNLNLPSNMFLLQSAQSTSVLPSNKIPTLLSTEKASFFVRPIDGKQVNIDLEQYRLDVEKEIEKAHLPM